MIDATEVADEAERLWRSLRIYEVNPTYPFELSELKITLLWARNVLSHIEKLANTAQRKEVGCNDDDDHWHGHCKCKKL